MSPRFTVLTGNMKAIHAAKKLVEVPTKWAQAPADRQVMGTMSLLRRHIGHYRKTVMSRTCWQIILLLCLNKTSLVYVQHCEEEARKLGFLSLIASFLRCGIQEKPSQ